MATKKITYVSALDSALSFLKDNGYDNEDVIKRLEDLRKAKANPSGTRKNPTRKENEEIANELVAIARETQPERITSAWARDNVPRILSVAKGTAILKCAADMGLIEKHVEQKSATRSALYYTLN